MTESLREKWSGKADILSLRSFNHAIDVLVLFICVMLYTSTTVSLIGSFIWLALISVAYSIILKCQRWLKTVDPEKTPDLIGKPFAMWRLSGRVQVLRTHRLYYALRVVSTKHTLLLCTEFHRYPTSPTKNKTCHQSWGIKLYLLLVLSFTAEERANSSIKEKINKH